MPKLVLLSIIIAGILACNNSSNSEKLSTTDTNSVTKPEPNPASPALPSFVAFRNWEIGDPARINSVLSVYSAWDSRNTDSMALYFSDSAIYDFPNGTRRITTSKTIEATFRKWRHEFGQTSNIPFSLISLHNKDFDQEWVIAWTWNKWQHANGKLDSALYCDSWRFKEGKINYLNSLENHTSQALGNRLNEKIPK